MTDNVQETNTSNPYSSLVGKERENIVYEPTRADIDNINEIVSFLNENNIPYTQDDSLGYGVFSLNDGSLQLRYVNSSVHRIDLSKRFGDTHKGVAKNHFVDLSHHWLNKSNTRIIWIFDFEMHLLNAVGFRRQWEVIKNTVLTATGNIRHRFYARDCEVREIPNSELRPFLETNCFYGYRAANKNLGLYLKKDKNGLKQGELLFCYSFGYNFYGNRSRPDNPFIEIIRVSTRIGCQVIGGASKCLKHFLTENPTLTINKREVRVEELKFYVDASHNDGRGMISQGFHFTEWKGGGFMNVFAEDIDEIYERSDGQKIHIKGKRGEIQHRKPAAHKRIMELIRDGKIYSVENAGTSVWSITRDEYLERFSNG